MGLLTKVIIVATLTVALIACTAIAISINSPQGALFVGSTYPITWTPTETQTGIIGICPQSNTNACTNINSNVDLSKGTYSWVVTGSTGSYVFFINDGTGEKFSGPFQITNRGGSSNSGSSPTATGSGSSSNSNNTASPTGTSETTSNGSTTENNTGGNTTPTSGSNTGSSGSSTTTPTKSGASTLRSSLLGLFVGLGVVASVMIQLF